MTWSDVIRPPKPRVVRQFGFVCLGVFGGIGLYQSLARGRPGLGWSLLGLGVVCLVLGLTAPRLFRWFYTGAMVVVFPIGFVVSQVLLAVLFFVAFLGVGLFLRVKRWDAMLRQPKAPGASYWEAKPRPGEASRYLRQY
jgi:hypothetical protein